MRRSRAMLRPAAPFDERCVTLSTVEAKTIEIRQILDSIGNEHRQQVFMVHLFPNQQDKMSTKFTIMGEIIFEHPIFHYI